MKSKYVSLLVAIIAAFTLSSTARAQCEDAKLTASDIAPGDEFGHSVSLSGTRALVGSAADDDAGVASGAAYVFELIAGSWVETTKLTASDAECCQLFGYSVSISGNRALVGAPTKDNVRGAAYLFELGPNGWVEMAKLMASDGTSNDAFGNAVALEGDRALIGAFMAGNRGAAYVFEWTGTAWVQVAKLKANDAELFDGVGASVALSGTTALLGAPGEGDVACPSGAAYVFEKQGTTWKQVAKLKSSDPECGDAFGKSTSISGTTAVVGAIFDDDAGAVYVFDRGRNGTWGPNETNILHANDSQAHDKFGGSLSTDGLRILTSSRTDDDLGDASGSAYLFERRPSGWVQTAKFLASDGGISDLLGFSVSLSANLALVSAHHDDDACPGNLGCNSGAAYVFTVPGTLGQSYCGPAVANGSGQGAVISAVGYGPAACDTLALVAEQLPANQFGYFIASQTQSFIPGAGGSQGNLCLGGQIGRFRKQIQNSGDGGLFSIDVDLSAIPVTPPHTVQPGETWSFQAWFRDKNPTKTSNFTDGVEITFF